MQVDEEFEGIELERLQAYVENGRTEQMPDEVVQYLAQLEVVRGQIERHQSRKFIINLLMSPVYGLSEYLAGKRWADAINFFYIDSEIKKSAWRNLYAQKMDQGAALIIHTAKTSQDVERYIKALKEAAEMRDLKTPDVEKLPAAAYAKPNKVYVLNAEFLGITMPPKKELAAHIDGLDISETERERIKAEALVTKPKLFLDEDGKN